MCVTASEAILKPLLKSPKLDLLLSNFGPVSNLAYLGKLAEWFVSKQLMRYVELTDMVEPYQLIGKIFLQKLHCCKLKQIYWMQ